MRKIGVDHNRWGEGEERCTHVQHRVMYSEFAPMMRSHAIHANACQLFVI